jgi:cysteinyl-tRNA synthetase
VHHTNEIAQSEAGYGVRPWVRFWMHNGWLMFGGGKMAKSSGKVLTLDDLVAGGVEPLAFRYFLLNAHYRQELHWNGEALEGARNAYQRLVRRAAELRAGTSSRGAELVPGFRERFRAALRDDLNTPQGLAVVWEVVRSDELGDVEKSALLAGFDEVLGLDLARAQIAAEPELPEGAAALVREREAARKARDFARSDALRAELRDTWGILVEDGPRGQTWRRA